MDEDRALVARQLVQIAKDLDRAVPGIQLIITGGGNVFDEIKAQADQVNADLGRTCVVDDRSPHRYQRDCGGG